MPAILELQIREERELQLYDREQLSNELKNGRASDEDLQNRQRNHLEDVLKLLTHHLAKRILRLLKRSSDSVRKLGG